MSWCTSLGHQLSSSPLAAVWCWIVDLSSPSQGLTSSSLVMLTGTPCSDGDPRVRPWAWSGLCPTSRCWVGCAVGSSRQWWCWMRGVGRCPTWRVRVWRVCSSARFNQRSSHAAHKYAFYKVGYVPYNLYYNMQWRQLIYTRLKLLIRSYQQKIGWDDGETAC